MENRKRCQAASSPKNRSFTSWRLLWIVCCHKRYEHFSRELKSSLYLKFWAVCNAFKQRFEPLYIDFIKRMKTKTFYSFKNHIYKRLIAMIGLYGSEHCVTFVECHPFLLSIKCIQNLCSTYIQKFCSADDFAKRCVGKSMKWNKKLIISLTLYS